ncbi:phosphatidate cytidylyltransferase [Prolixibacteraceae bacterium Z1-6]|uniref:Phosphatidate cytidylyltransferase n=1 Tax=Draconibacterium aestuarii TaxID=2998507 RepID=A0A9X3J4G2_9BACT|nr:phosphatidate cytidylyltransferase [Prolixibacteraceae bacterium Z1-6]
MSNLVKRTIFGAVYVLIMLGGTLIHPYAFALIFAAILFFTQFEFYNVIEQAGHKPSKWLGTISGVLFFLISFLVSIGIFHRTFSLTFIPIIVFIFIFEIISSREHTLENSGLSVLGFIYIAGPFSFMNFLIHTSVNDQTNSFYPWILAGIFLILWVNDSFAYLIGSACGKHKMCEKISPKKSWEGLIGGAVFATIMGIINAVLFQAISMTSWIVIALLTVIFGTFGDLFQSKLKREIGVKDSGKILPGHGGFLDRLDSLLFAIPIIFMWLMISGNF